MENITNLCIFSVEKFYFLPLSVISQSLGHDSELTTRIYLQELDNSIIDRANSHLLNVVLKGKVKNTGKCLVPKSLIEVVRTILQRYTFNMESPTIQ